MIVDPDDDNQAEKIIDRLKYASITDAFSAALARMIQEEIDKDILEKITQELLEDLR